MSIKEIQKWVADDWKNTSRKQPEIHLQLLYMMEEMGEVAEAIRKGYGEKNRKQSPVDLGSEIADLVISIVTIANHFQVDIEDELDRFKQRLQQRQAAS